MLLLVDCIWNAIFVAIYNNTLLSKCAACRLMSCTLVTCTVYESYLEQLNYYY